MSSGLERDTEGDCQEPFNPRANGSAGDRHPPLIPRRIPPQRSGGRADGRDGARSEPEQAIGAAAVRLDPRLAQTFSDPSAVDGLVQVKPRPARDDLAVRHAPSPAVEINERGNIRRASGDWSGAVEEYTRALAADPRSADALALRGWARLCAGENGADADARAWHAGVSRWQGRERCNDFSIGIELEGSDYTPFAAEQYQKLTGLLTMIAARYPLRHLVGHNDIAPQRKTDPGPYFDWRHVARMLPDELRALCADAAGHPVS